MENRLDKLISWLSPATGMRRAAARLASREFSRLPMNKGNGFDAVNDARTTKSFTEGNQSADVAIEGDAQKLRNRVRSLVRNNPYVARIVNSTTDGAIGAGLIPQSSVVADASNEGGAAISQDVADNFNGQAEELYKQWTHEADACGRMTFEEIQRLCTRKIMEDGEIFVRKVAVDDESRAIPLALQVYEADQVETPDDLKNDSNVKHGVKVGGNGEPVEYYVLRSHPGDASTIRLTKVDDDFDTVPAGEMIHLYRVLRPGQTRGYSPIAPALAVIQHMDRYWEAEIVAARAAACYAGFIRTPSPGLSLAGLSASTGDPENRKAFDLKPGLFKYLSPGEEIDFFDPKRPNQAFSQFSEALIRAIGLAVSMPYELLALDFSKTNFSSARAALLEARMHFDTVTKHVTNHLCIPVWSEMIRDAVAAAAIGQPAAYNAQPWRFQRSRWTHPGYKWIDPLKEAMAAKVAIDSGIKTMRDVVATDGKDVEEHIKQLGQEEELLEASGFKRNTTNNSLITLAMQEDDDAPVV